MVGILKVTITFKRSNIIQDMKPLEFEAKIFKALMHPARIAILQELRQDEQCVCHLEAKLSYRQAYISQQLMVLRDAGIVEDRRDGWNIFYRVVERKIFSILDTAAELASTGNPEAANLSPPLHQKSRSKSKDCPCPKCNPGNEKKSC